MRLHRNANLLRFYAVYLTPARFNSRRYGNLAIFLLLSKWKGHQSAHLGLSEPSFSLTSSLDFLALLEELFGQKHPKQAQTLGVRWLM